MFKYCNANIYIYFDVIYTINYNVLYSIYNVYRFESIKTEYFVSDQSEHSVIPTMFVESIDVVDKTDVVEYIVIIDVDNDCCSIQFPAIVDSCIISNPILCT